MYTQESACEETSGIELPWLPHRVTLMSECV